METKISTEIRIASLNLCLGLKNKRDEVERIISDNSIDILCMQETEVENNLDHSSLNLKKLLFRN